MLFGGRSAEHDVSVLSATNVMRALEPAKYDAVPVFITRDGQWLLSSFEAAHWQSRRRARRSASCRADGGASWRSRQTARPTNCQRSTSCFPVLHGLHGEDGSVQGLAEVAGVPLAGCGILGSATALDKDIAKRLLKEAGLPTARSVTIHHGAAPAFAELQRALGLPLFIKPARQGSSVGVSKVSTERDYEAALAEGFQHDRKLLAEEFIRGREIECSVLEDTQGGLFVSRPGEIVPAESHGFYSYDAKYIDEDGAALKVPAELPEEIEGRDPRRWRRRPSARSAATAWPASISS